MTFVYGDVCTGMSAASQAWMPLGATPAFYAEVEAFPCGVLGARFSASRPRRPIDPDSMPTEKERKQWAANNRELERMADRGAFGNGTPNLGDFTQIDPTEWGQVEWLVGGTPCQDFSVAGGRIGLSGHRGNLSLAFIGLCHELADHGSLRGAVWENVPGVLSDRKNAFGCFLGALVGHDAPIKSPHGKGRWTDAGVVVGPRARAAWRVLDAQHFGLPQRRRRLFVVVCFGDGPDPVRILLERQGVRRPAAAGSAAGQDIAPTLAGGARSGGGNNQAGPIDIATARNAHGGPHGRLDFESETFVVEPIGLSVPAKSLSGTLTAALGRRNGQPDNASDDVLIPVAYAPELANTLKASGFDASEDGTGRQPAMIAHAYVPDVAGTLTARSSRGGGQTNTPGHNADQALVAHAFSLRGRDGENQIEPEVGDVAPALRTGDGGSSKSFVSYGIASDALDRSGEGAAGNAAERAGLGIHEELSPTLIAKRANGVAHALDAIRWAVRRLMPTECEALQGAARDFTRIPWRGKPAEQCPDGPRYKVIGNSMAIAVMAWLGRQIIEAEAEWRASKNEAA